MSVLPLEALPFHPDHHLHCTYEFNSLEYQPTFEGMNL